MTTTLDELASQLDGALVRPADDGYDEARSVWNGMIDLRPAAIARCASTHDVQVALRAAQTAGLPIAVRGGGHTTTGS
jgi:FAD/FMN-containing dehydrogenase